MTSENYAQRPAPLTGATLAERMAQLEYVIFGPETPEETQYIEPAYRVEAPTGLIPQQAALQERIAQLEAQLAAQQPNDAQPPVIDSQLVEPPSEELQ